ncbi:L,D-transpeptidase [Lacibacterium aquatile]|uniref:L,D-transpeptidase n=1 Tax=Lacibacterium aquatile TaxID=1168082 RepID=A0ABW5DL78_9PROT
MSTRNTLIFAGLWTLAAAFVGGTGLLIWQDRNTQTIDPETVVHYGYRGAPEDRPGAEEQPLIAATPQAQPAQPPQEPPPAAAMAPAPTPPASVPSAPAPLASTPVPQAAPPAARAIAPIEASRNLPPAPPAPRLDPVPVHLIPEPGAVPPVPSLMPRSAPLPEAVPITVTPPAPPAAPTPAPAAPAPQSLAVTPAPSSPLPHTDGAPPLNTAQAHPAPGYIVISVPQRKLRYFPADGSEPVTYPVAIGRERSIIPFGVSEVVRKRRNPTWHPTPTMRKSDPSLPVSVPPGPRNPLGAFALDLGWTYYAIHGTNDPRSIGRAASSGCFRMHPDHIAALFPTVPVGTKVEVIDAPLPATAPPPSAHPAA